MKIYILIMWDDENDFIFIIIFNRYDLIIIDDINVKISFMFKFNDNVNYFINSIYRILRFNDIFIYKYEIMNDSQFIKIFLF